MSMRNIERHVSRSCGYEFEDMICDELDFAQLVAPGPPAAGWAGRCAACATS
jgi:hypothetical protein